MIKRINGKWHMGVKRPDGTSDWVEMDGAEDRQMQERNKGKREAWNRENKYQKDKDYSGSHKSLFGSNFGGDLHYGGPNSNWGHALRDRLGRRQDGHWNHGYYENVTSSSNSENRARMYARNNAIEDMYRRGYSWGQINDHLQGKVNALEVGPDWADYNSRRDSGIGEDYFIGVPDGVKNAYVPNGPQDPGFWNPNNVGQSGGAWGAGGQQTGNSQAQVNPKRMVSQGLFSPENEVMRQFISKNLKSRLFGV